MADELAVGRPVPNDLGLAWLHEDYMKARNYKEYVPFTVTFDPSKVPGSSLTFYWRVVSAGAKDRTFAWEDVAYDVSLAGATSGLAPVRLSRAFSVPAGTYDVYVVAKALDSLQTGAPPPRASALKYAVTVPDFWNAELNTSSVIMAQTMNPVGPLTPQQQTDRPYALGAMELVPQVESTYRRTAEMQPVFFVYNPRLDAANKPNVVMEYTFYSRIGGTEKFFNRTAPQNFNAETQAAFDAAAGHQISGGLAIPLASFPDGDYRLEIKVTDRIATKSITRDVIFSVSGPFPVDLPHVH